MTTRKVPLDQIEKVRELTDNYRKYRALRKKLRDVQTQLSETIERFERSITERTRRPLAYLGCSTNLSTKTRSMQQKTHDNRKASGS
jgi:hypothetical protein